MPSSELLNDLISSEHVVLQTLVNAMTLIGGYNGLKGDEKKDLVLKIIDYELELPETLENLVSAMIDLLIKVENRQIFFNPKKISLPIYSCWRGRK